MTPSNRPNMTEATPGPFVETCRAQQTRDFVEALRLALIDACLGCCIQKAADGSDWPCGTCVTDLLANLLPERNPEYHRHNAPVDRSNEVWRAILQLRDYPARTPYQPNRPCV